MASNSNANVNANDSNVNDSETPWVFIESYFKQKHLKQLVKHQLESYNYFVNNQIQNTIDMFKILYNNINKYLLK
jgi:DNA-directed RNA polymerase beta subunit